MCWVALDRLLELDRSVRLGIRVDRVERERSAIANAIESQGYNPALASYVGELGGDSVDASLLLMPSLGYGDPANSRMRTTYERIEQRLGRNGLLYRYEPYFDSISVPEGTFGICGFWAAENLAHRGEVEQAELLLDQLLLHANDVGLFAEEIDPENGAALGNFPQAFTHVGHINAAFAIARARAEPSP